MGWDEEELKAKFQSTLPSRGATAFTKLADRITPSFQSTLPSRGATIGKDRSTVYRYISIHAPLTGSDHGL